MEDRDVRYSWEDEPQRVGEDWFAASKYVADEPRPIIRGGTHGCMGQVWLLLPFAVVALLAFIVALVFPVMWFVYLGFALATLYWHRLAVTGYPRGKGKR